MFLTYDLFTEKKLRNHVESTNVRKEPNIQCLARTYNGLCAEIQKLVDEGKAPLGAQAPNMLKSEGLFKLDVDDEIWQDIGMEDVDGPEPAWLGDRLMCDGIRMLLQYDRCVEEEKCLIREVHAMKHWMQEEWLCVQSCIEISGLFYSSSIGMAYNVYYRG